MISVFGFAIDCQNQELLVQNLSLYHFRAVEKGLGWKPSSLRGVLLSLNARMADEFSRSQVKFTGMPAKRISG